jgi:hypothetical protein
MHEGRAEPLLDAHQLFLHLAAECQIERAQGFVQQQHRRIDRDRPREGHTLPLEKTADVFFAGQVTLNSTVREAGMRQLETLAARGYRIDIARERLPYREFLARCARSWLTWSPEGYGWDCRRHYEAALCRSVPLMSRATIHRHRPLVAGEHGFYYDVEGDGLIRAAEDALADKERLARIAEASRTHVLTHHTYEAICRYMVGELAAKLAGEDAPVPVSG